MTISNIKNVIKIRQLKLFATIIVIIPISIAFASDWYSYIFDLNPFFYAGFFLLIYVGFIAYIEKLKYNYIQYADEGEKIVFRYYPLRIFSRKYKAIEIPKFAFIKFETKISFNNKVEEIILFQKTKKGIFQYPPISISALSENDKIRLKQSLLSFSKND